MEIELIIPDTVSWNGPSRKQVFVKHLQEAGHSVECIPRSKRQRGKYPNCIRKQGVDLVVNHTMTIPPDHLDATVKANSSTKFIYMNHSSLGYLHSKPYNSDLATSSIWSASRNANVWYCTHERSSAEALIELGAIRCASLPIAMNKLAGAQAKPINESPVLVLAGRCVEVKNMFAAIHVCALAAKRGWKIVVSGELDSSCKNMLHALRVKYEHLGMQPFHKWEEFLRTRAHVVLQMSYAESFCITALDAMQCGVPVLSCGTIKFADPSLVVPADEPCRAVRLLDSLRVAETYKTACSTALDLARDAVAWQNRAYLGTLGYIGSKCSGRVKELCRRAFLFQSPRIVEVGVRMSTTCKAVMRFHASAEYHAVDNWAEGNHSEAIPKRAFLHEKPSVEAADDFADESCDIVFIDADHSYQSAKEDIAAWRRKVAPGGWLGGHDYDHPDYPSVKQAVDEMQADGIQVVTGENYTWWTRC